MRKIYDPKAAAAWITQSRHRPVLEMLKPALFLLEYEKGELVTSPLIEEKYFQVVAKGSLNIYFIRDDGGRYSLSSGDTDYILGDMDLFDPHNTGSIYTEAAEPLLTLALPIGQNQETLLGNNLFLQMVCRSLTAKMQAITALDAAPASLSDRVLSYMRYKCPQGILKGLEQESFRLHCSSRQLQRILNRLEQDGRVAKIGKGAYQLPAEAAE